MLPHQTKNWAKNREPTGIVKEGIQELKKPNEQEVKKEEFCDADPHSPLTPTPFIRPPLAPRPSRSADPSFNQSPPQLTPNSTLFVQFPQLMPNLLSDLLQGDSCQYGETQLSGNEGTKIEFGSDTIENYKKDIQAKEQEQMKSIRSESEKRLQMFKADTEAQLLAQQKEFERQIEDQLKLHSNKRDALVTYCRQKEEQHQLHLNVAKATILMDSKAVQTDSNEALANAHFIIRRKRIVRLM